MSILSDFVYWGHLKNYLFMAFASPHTHTQSHTLSISLSLSRITHTYILTSQVTRYLFALSAPCNSKYSVQAHRVIGTLYLYNYVGRFASLLLYFLRVIYSSTCVRTSHFSFAALSVNNRLIQSVNCEKNSASDSSNIVWSRLPVMRWLIY